MKYKDLQKRDKKLLDQFFGRRNKYYCKNGEVKLNYYSGSGSLGTKSHDYVERLSSLFSELKLKKGMHFETGNKQKYKGFEGKYIKLLNRGSNLKIIKETIKELTADSNFSNTYLSKPETRRSQPISYAEQLKIIKEILKAATIAMGC